MTFDEFWNKKKLSIRKELINMFISSRTEEFRDVVDEMVDYLEAVMKNSYATGSLTGVKEVKDVLDTEVGGPVGGKLRRHFPLTL